MSKAVCVALGLMVFAVFQALIIVHIYDMTLPWTIMEQPVFEAPIFGETESEDTGLRHLTRVPGMNSTDTASRQSQQYFSAETLYAKDGHQHLAASRLDSAKLAPLTQWVQEQIFKHQHPIKCEKVLVSDGWRAGFGAELHVVGTHLARAIETGNVLVWGSEACKYLNDVPCQSATGSSRCACFFQEPSNCTSNNNSQHIDGRDFQHVIPSRFVSALKEEVPGMTEAQIRYWWRAQSIGYLARLNDRTISDVRNLRTRTGLHIFSSQHARRFPLPAGTVSDHIRGGDKRMEMKLVGPEEYVKAALKMAELNPLAFQSRTLFVSGDDLTSVLAACNMIQKSSWTCVYSNTTRMSGGFKMASFHRFEREKVRAFTLNVILQLLMSLEAESWIGTRDSNCNRMIDELRCVWVDKCGGTYIEVGKPKEYNW